MSEDQHSGGIFLSVDKQVVIRSVVIATSVTNTATISDDEQANQSDCTTGIVENPNFVHIW